MELSLNNEPNKRVKEDDLITSFSKELQNTLDKNSNKEAIPISYKDFCNEIYNEIDIAKNYKKDLPRIVKDCMKDLSHESEFFYLNYDNRKDSYSLDYYHDGSIEKIELTEKEIKDANYKVGMFYINYDEDNFLEADYLKDSIKSDVQIALNDLDRKIGK